MITKNRILFTVYLNHRCNLRCDYCFAKGLNDRKEISNPLMCKIVDFAQKFSIENRSKCEIGFFGKEPLLSFGQIQKSVEYSKARKYKISYSINTNGILLDREILKFLFKNNFKIVLSRDRMISEKEGVKDYSPYQNKEIMIRTTINSANIRYLDEILSYFADAGFLNISIGFDYTDPHFSDLGYDELFDYMIRGLLRYVDLKMKVAELRVPLFDRLLSAAIDKTRRHYSSYPFCQLGKHIFSFDIDGGIYPCWRFIGDKKSQIGDIRRGIIKEEKKRIQLKRSTRSNIMPFDFICYWAYKNNKIWFKNNLRILETLKRMMP